MTTFAQWRSPSGRLEAKPEVKPQKYDIRVVDQFYSYCKAVSSADAHRAAAAKSLVAAKLNFWKLLIAATLVCYYVVERVAQAMSLY